MEEIAIFTIKAMVALVIPVTGFVVFGLVNKFKCKHFWELQADEKTLKCKNCGSFKYKPCDHTFEVISKDSYYSDRTYKLFTSRCTKCGTIKTDEC